MLGNKTHLPMLHYSHHRTMSKMMKMVIKDKHNFGVIESDLHFESAICDKGPKQRLMTISQLSLFLKIGKENET